jgi:hypothetical protein
MDQEVVEHDQQVQIQFGDVHAMSRPLYLIFKFLLYKKSDLLNTQFCA